MKICRGCFEEYNEKLDICPHCGFDEEENLKESVHLPAGYLLKGNYLIGKVLGFGGFGVTYLAYNNKLKTKVAIKEYLPSEFSTRSPGSTNVIVYKGDKEEQFSDGVKKFVSEANRLAKFRDTEGVVQIFESFEENGTAYIVMEYLIGETLTKYLSKRGKVPADEAINLMMPIVKPLEAIHKENIIHRDIAPDNIILTKDGKVKLIDFGAARFSTASHSRSLTVLVKAGYSPEEQYRSRGDQGPWTDVYALCAVLYKMITGVRPPDALERRAFFEGKKKDILEPISKYSSDITENEENAILNGMNVQIQDRSRDMVVLEYELTTEDEVKRRAGTIKKIDILKWPLWAKIGTPIVFAGLVVLIILFSLGGDDDHPPKGTAKVPYVIGEEVDIASEMIEKAATYNDEKGKDGINLHPVIAGVKFDETIPGKRVVDQLVDAGTMLPLNSNVEIIISAGTEEEFIQELRKKQDDGKYVIPYIVGMQEKDAEKYLGEGYQNMKISIVEKISPNYAMGIVMEVSPSPGTPLAEGSNVKLTVCQGPEPIDMPNVTGISISKAKSVLMKAGIPVKITYKNVTGKEDIVLGQDPPAGIKSIVPGSPATLTVSTKEETYPVPEGLAGLTEKQAEDKIKAAGFKVGKNNEAYADDVAKGKVISNSPGAGTMLVKGAVITITVSKGEKINIFYNANGGSDLKTKKQSGIAEEGIKIAGAPSTPKQYTIKFNADGGSTSGEKVVKAKFVSWGSYNPGDEYTGREDLNLVAEWGAGTMPSLPTSTKKFNDFKGWYTAKTGGSAVSTATPVTSDMTLYARWEEHGVSKWVDVSKVPKDAEIVFYRYDLEKTGLTMPSGYECVGVEWKKVNGKTDNITTHDKKLSKTKMTKYAINGKKEKVEWSESIDGYKYERYVLPDGTCYPNSDFGGEHETKLVKKKIKEGKEGAVDAWFYVGESRGLYDWHKKVVSKYKFEKNVEETEIKPPSGAKNIEVKYREA